VKMSPEPALQPAGVRSLPVTAWQGGQRRAQPDWLAEEVPVALVFNGLSHAVMMATPADLDDFALGFCLTEGLLLGPQELYGTEQVATPLGIELQLEVASAAFHRLKERRRNLTGRTGCGLCGTDSLGQVQRPLPPVPLVQVGVAAIARAQRALRSWQSVQQLTGASHAAAWCGLNGDILCVREDVGRHNALDKLIGALLRAGTPRDQGFVCITSRASFEMVQKTALAGAGLLAAVSAPTALAVDTALACGLALAGFVRGDDLVAYTHPERFGLADAPTPPDA
jgi:FdhD protein